MTDFQPRRRALLAAGIGALLLPVTAGAGTAHADSAPPATDSFAALRARAAELATGGAIDPLDPVYTTALTSLNSSAAAQWAALDRSAGRTALWSDLAPVTAPSNFTLSYGRLLTLATAWATPGAALRGDEEVAAAVVEGLAFLFDRAYNPAKPESGNWWFWEIGAPRNLMDVCVLLHDRIAPERIANYCAVVDRFCANPDRRTNLPTLAETGANRADKAAIVALRGIVGGSADKLALARDGLSDARDAGRNSLFRYVASGDGFYLDGSFIQHNDVAYTGTYGNVLLSRVAYLAALLADSDWRITDAGISVIHESVERSFAAVTFDGLMMDAVRGRAVSRNRERDFHTGSGTTSNVLLLAMGAPPEYAARWRSIAKGWIERNTATPYLPLVGIAATRRASAVLSDPAIPAAPPPVGHTVFADMDRVVHRRPAWTLALSLSSKRIAAYEAGNGENLHGWHTGDGMTYLYDADRAQYSDDFWPTVDPYRLPGTTVDTRPRADAGSTPGTSTYRPANTVAGGAVLDGRYGAAAMELIGNGSTLRARKAWFCLDDAVVALGAGITASDGRTIETVVENRNLHAEGANLLTVDGRDVTDVVGRATPFPGAGWAHLEGVGGYVFPGGADLQALREDRAGAWSDINTGADTGGSGDTTTRRYATLWLDHGVSPADAGYAYVLLPGFSPARTAAWAASRPVEIVANTAAAQAIRVRALGLIAVHFWAAGSVAGITSSGPGTVLLRRRDEGVSVAVADPGRTGTTLTVELPWAVEGVRSTDDTVTVASGRRPVLTVRVGGSRGHTHAAELF
ncbi:polysaccharide lyase 8 family protein [Streptomyces solicathayae]|uniref:Polysaccharide lyase 8 family protein n=1 Tax=Streptomyces solicathayae TaxID=3081768 RepID=A0ABZ0LL67_9ACTN|nr:polysaccharide lyase 8 family protein [Streptomyces sp. HUAS YS2]WOX20010.1 polysaccharide lyase 8 family protein [Streptomyces sp. HUAS YS2]